MTRVNAKEARANFRKLLDQVADGSEIAIIRRGKEVARLVPPLPQRKAFPFTDLAKLRASIKVKGEPLSKTVIKMRREARY